MKFCALLVSLLILPIGSYAADYELVCFGCLADPIPTTGFDPNTVLPGGVNVPVIIEDGGYGGRLSRGLSNHYHVLDLNYGIMNTIIFTGYPDGSSKATTRSIDSNYIDEFYTILTEYNKIIDATTSKPIPEDVVPNAWSLVSCFSCPGEIENYLETTSQFQMRNFLSKWNIKHNFKQKLTFDLEVGGVIEVSVTKNERGDWRIELLEIRDADNNAVPLTSEELSGGAITVRSQARIESINIILNDFGLFLSPPRIGRIIIRECPSSGCPKTNIP